MLSWILIYFLLYAVLLGTIMVLGYFLQRQKESKLVSKENRIDLAELVVIIPFRNEEKRIHVLLESIKKSALHPKQYIFVNDHSTDQSCERIEQVLNEAIPYHIISLENGVEGKKLAIRKGIELSESTYVLGWDADCSFLPNYFERLCQLPAADLYVMPAVMVAEREFEYLYEVDLLLVNAANCGVSGLIRPIMASGANMLYKRSAFQSYDQYASHAHMPSGDDIYLLRDFRKAKANVHLVTDRTLAVYTETPQSFKEFLHQRLRWIAKTGDVKDHLSTSLAIIQGLLTAGFVALMVYVLLQQEWKWVLVVFIVKSVIDLLFFLPFFNRMGRMRSWLYIPLYEVLFPFYTLLIVSLMYTFKPKWKGRKLERNF
jgi:biofilm PGA synthesis N-glycosyltransferase PgaC